MSGHSRSTLRVPTPGAQPAYRNTLVSCPDNALTGFHVTGSLLEITRPTTRPTVRTPSRTDVSVSGIFAGRILVGSYLDFSAKLRGVSGGEAMSDRRRFLKGLTSLPLATG